MRIPTLILAFSVVPAVLRSQGRGCPAPPATTVSAPAEGIPPFDATIKEIPIIAPSEGWEIGRISWVAAERNGLIYLIQRGDKADPIIVIDRAGKVVRSWGKGLYSMPHSIRIDPQGNVWTTDAFTSMILKFTPDGRELMRIDVGDVPAACPWLTRGVADIAFGPNGHVYVADGYTNTRVVEYAPDGRKVREWGTPGSARGEFNLPHSIVIDSAGTIFVADRENSRIQRFDLAGKSLGEWTLSGKPYTLDIAQNGSLWVDMLVVPQAGVRQPTLARVDAGTGGVIGRIVTPGGHGIARLPGTDQLLIPAGSKLFLLAPK